MSYAGLCEMVAAKGWVIVVASQSMGPNMLAGDDDAYLRAIAIYESREGWRELRDPLVAVRLDEPSLSLDEAAEYLQAALHAGGVV